MALRGREVEKRRAEEDWEAVSRGKGMKGVIGGLSRTLRRVEGRCFGSLGNIFGVKSASARLFQAPLCSTHEVWNCYRTAREGT